MAREPSEEMFTVVMPGNHTHQQALPVQTHKIPVHGPSFNFHVECCRKTRKFARHKNISLLDLDASMIMVFKYLF